MLREFRYSFDDVRKQYCGQLSTSLFAFSLVVRLLVGWFDIFFSASIPIKIRFNGENFKLN